MELSPWTMTSICDIPYQTVHYYNNKIWPTKPGLPTVYVRLNKVFSIRGTGKDQSNLPFFQEEELLVYEVEKLNNILITVPLILRNT